MQRRTRKKNTKDFFLRIKANKDFTKTVSISDVREKEWGGFKPKTKSLKMALKDLTEKKIQIALEYIRERKCLERNTENKIEKDWLKWDWRG